MDPENNTVSSLNERHVAVAVFCALAGRAVIESAAATAERETAQLDERSRHVFDMIRPRPARYYSKCGLGTYFLDGCKVLGAHPDFRLSFEVPPDRRRIKAEFGIVPGAYEGVSAVEATDGVEFIIHAHGARDADRSLFDRVLRPKTNPVDRGPQSAEFEAVVEPGEELVAAAAPGPQNLCHRDWAYWRTIRIE